MSFHSFYFHSGAEQVKLFAYIWKGRGIVMPLGPTEKNFFFLFWVPLLTRPTIQ
jgi:hypothetical protein